VVDLSSAHIGEQRRVDARYGTGVLNLDVRGLRQYQYDDSRADVATVEAERRDDQRVETEAAKGPGR